MSRRIDEKPRVGLIVPSSNTVMEPDLHRHLGATCVISTSRIFLEEVTPEAERQMLDEELPRSIRLIKTTAPHVVVFGCTSAGSLGGTDHDAGIARRIERETGGKAVTVVGSVMGQLREIGGRRAAVFTPYEEELTRSVAGCVTEGGYDLAKAAGMGIRENRDIGKVTPQEIIRFVESQMSGVQADCIFLSCTNWQAIDAIESLRARFGIPTLSSNQATIEAVRALVG
jgi:maleate isomerase